MDLLLHGISLSGLDSQIKNTSRRPTLRHYLHPLYLQVSLQSLSLYISLYRQLAQIQLHFVLSGARDVFTSQREIPIIVLHGGIDTANNSDFDHNTRPQHHDQQFILVNNLSLFGFDNGLNNGHQKITLSSSPPQLDTSPQYTTFIPINSLVFGFSSNPLIIAGISTLFSSLMIYNINQMFSNDAIVSTTQSFMAQILALFLNFSNFIQTIHVSIDTTYTSNKNNLILAQLASLHAPKPKISPSGQPTPLSRLFQWQTLFTQSFPSIHPANPFVEFTLDHRIPYVQFIFPSIQQCWDTIQALAQLILHFYVYSTSVPLLLNNQDTSLNCPRNVPNLALPHSFRPFLSINDPYSIDRFKYSPVICEWLSVAKIMLQFLTTTQHNQKPYESHPSTDSSAFVVEKLYLDDLQWVLNEWFNISLSHGQLRINLQNDNPQLSSPRQPPTELLESVSESFISTLFQANHPVQTSNARIISNTLHSILQRSDSPSNKLLGLFQMVLAHDTVSGSIHELIRQTSFSNPTL
jgi:hypothetical protein